MTTTMGTSPRISGISLKQNEMSRRISHNHKEATSLKCVQTEDKEGLFLFEKTTLVENQGT